MFFSTHNLLYFEKNDISSVKTEFRDSYHLPDIVSILAQYHNKARLRGLSNVEELLIASPRSNNVTQDRHLAFMLLYALCLTLKAQSDIFFFQKKNIQA